MSENKVLVTGATGMLGSHLIKELLKQEQPVKAFYRSQRSVPGEKRIEWIQGDILDVSSLEEAMQGVTQVYHCAGMVSFLPDEKEKLYQTNVEGTANVVNACLNRGVQKLLHVSSVSALGKAKGNEIITESSVWADDKKGSIYGKTKHLAEMEVWRGTGEGLDAVVINPSIILGRGDWKEGSSKIFKTAYDEFPWYTDGVTGFVDAKDVAKAAFLLMNSEMKAERFIINAENVAYKQIFDLIADEFGKKRPFKKVSPLLASFIWRAEKLRYLFSESHPLLTRETTNNALAKRYFGGTKLLSAFPKFQYTPLAQTIARICADYKTIYQL